MHAATIQPLYSPRIMKNFLINIQSDSELISYEAIALAFTLATFDHQVQLCFFEPSQTVLTDKTSRLYGMIQSLSLYDLPAAAHQFDDEIFQKLDACIQQVFTQQKLNTADFDCVLNF